MTRLLSMRGYPLALLLLALAAGTADAADRPVVAIEDPSGDDLGSGALVYPQRSGFEPGDLDLVSLRVVRTDKSYRFEATLRNPVRDPADVRGDVGPESLATFARRGFYACNLDVYLDTDRVPGSGNTYTLPGRQVTIDPAHAWERAVILTPRPELMRKQLVAAVAEAESSADLDAVGRRIDGMIQFATEVRVRGRTISFSVPASFLNGPRPDAEWSVTAFVTGARTSVQADLDLFHASRPALERLELGVMQPRSGQSRDSFGYLGAIAPPPVVDLLAPPPLRQQELLAGGAPLPGVAGGPAVAGSAIAAPVSALVPVAPASAPAKTTPGTPAAAVATERPAPAAAPAPDPATAPLPPAAPSTDIEQRLRRLDELRAKGLVSEAEYRAARERILADL